jgi:DNA-binding transcriptional LysR family regulator
MRRIRIALGEAPAELHRLVEQGLAGQPDLTLVATTSGEVALMLEAGRADVVVVAMRRGEIPAVAERLLDEYPRLGVVCVDVEVGRGAVYRLRPDLEPMAAASPGAIAAAIRSVVDDNAAWGHR